MSRPEGAERALPIESIRVGDKLTITAIPLKRRPNPFSASEGRQAEAFKEAIAKLLKEADGAIFEYFPEEGPSLVPRKYREIHGDVMAFFGPLAELVKKHEKPVYVFDPAYDEKFAALFHELPEIIGLLGGIPLGTGMIFGFLKGVDKITSRRSEKDSKPEKERRRQEKVEEGGGRRKISRKQFLLGSALSAAGLATLASAKYVEDASFEVLTGTPSTSRFPSESKVRRAIIAKGISQLSENLDKDSSMGAKNLVLFYPPIHWKGIKGLLENRQRLEEEFGLYSMLKQGRLKDAFFTARKYEWAGREWGLEKAEIGGDPGPTIQ